MSFDLSPDGRWIVFDLLGQLWRIPADGGEAAPLTDAVRDRSHDVDPNFSPDGRWIAFQRYREGGAGLWLLHAEEGEPSKLSGFDVPGHLGWRPHARPAWSPDGHAIAYGFRTELRVHELASGTTRTVELADSILHGVADPLWLPGGAQLLYRDGATLGDGQWGFWLGDPGEGIFRLDLESGAREEVLPAGTGAVSPALAPDGGRLAYFTADEHGAYQLWTVDLAGGEPVRLTDHEDVTPSRARWTPGGEHVLYVAEGRFWRVPARGGAPVEVPFRARIEFDQRVPAFTEVRFPAPGTEGYARGHRGIALSPDGERVALIALGQLWIWRPREEPVSISSLPATAMELAWSPDGREIAWSAGREGRRQLFATDVATGETRRLTDLPAQAYRPRWSPDGERVAFIHAWGDGRDLRVGVLDPRGAPVSDTSDPSYPITLRRPFLMQEQGARALWSPDGRKLLVHGHGPSHIVALDGTAGPLQGVDGPMDFLHWLADGSIVFTRHNLLWRARLAGDSVGEPAAIGGAAAIYPVPDRSGRVLYLSDDGYHVAEPGGGSRALGWPPIRYRVPDAPPLLIRNVRIVGGAGALPDERHDLLVESGRIARIAPAGRIAARDDTRIIEGNGRTIIPGLIDLHVHDLDPISLAGMLYWGVTTAADMSSDVAGVAAVAEGIASDAFAGPRLVFGGFAFFPGLPGGDGASGPRIQMNRDTSANARALGLLRALGGSHVKMQLAGDPKVGTDFIRQAGELGLRVGGHAPRLLTFVAAGVNDQQHWAGGVRDDLVQLFRHGGVSVVPTLVLWTTRSRARADTTYLDEPDVAAFMTPYYRDRVRAIIDACMGPWRGCTDSPEGREAVSRLHRGGVRVGAGTDYTIVPIPGALHWEFEELVEAGLSPLEAILAATTDAAGIIGADAEIGAIQEGHWADLVILDADPLEDIRHTRRIHAVIKGGRIVDRRGLVAWARRQ